MRPCPPVVGNARVVCYTAIDSRHHRTGNATHVVTGQEAEPAHGLAIRQYDGDDAFYLFACDAEWNSQTDTWHQSLEDAKEQAEFEYQRTSQTWVSSQ